MSEYIHHRLHGLELVLVTVIVIEAVYLSNCVMLLCPVQQLHATLLPVVMRIIFMQLIRMQITLLRLVLLLLS